MFGAFQGLLKQLLVCGRFTCWLQWVGEKLGAGEVGD